MKESDVKEIIELLTRIEMNTSPKKRNYYGTNPTPAEIISLVRGFLVKRGAGANIDQIIAYMKTQGMYDRIVSVNPRRWLITVLWRERALSDLVMKNSIYTLVKP